jgi:hypothetical protein
MPYELKKAARRALSLQIGFYGPSGSGKTMSALLFAAGLAGPDGKVAVIDTERGRASMYADNKRVMAALPHSYDVIEIDQPYHPDKFVEALTVMEEAGVKVALVDSESDLWDGPGGCSDIAEKNKGRWNKAKLFHKRYKTHIALSDMHVISLFKAQEKTKIIEKKDSPDGKEHHIPLGIQPICEKNAFYPLLLGFSIDPKTHLATEVKDYEDLRFLFKEPKLITKEDGERVRVWNESGQKVDATERLRQRARVAAEQGVKKYSEFFQSLNDKARAYLEKTVHEEYRFVAEQADLAAQAEEEQEPDFAAA